MGPPFVARYVPICLRAMTNPSLKLLAWTCKILAIVICVGFPVMLHPRWGINRFADFELIALALLSLIPNRWVVFSRTSFATFLLLTLFPLNMFLHISAYRHLDLESVTAMIVVIFFFAPLPVSLVLSRMRLQRGDRFTYA
jgi:hypothetical protein